MSLFALQALAVTVTVVDDNGWTKANANAVDAHDDIDIATATKRNGE